jgi:hypothetical protein
MKVGSNSKNKRNVCSCRPVFTVRIGVFTLIAIAVLVQRSQLRISRQLPINREATHQISQQYQMIIPVAVIEHLEDAGEILRSSDDIALHRPNALTDADVVRAVLPVVRPSDTKVSSSVYKLPNKPIHNILSILKQSIGTTILQDSKKSPLRNCSPTVQFQLRSHIKKINDIVATEYTIQAMMMEATIKSSQAKRPINIIPKHLGGDEIYVEWVSSVDSSEMGIAMMTDMKNGTYILKFVRPPILQQNYTKRETQIEQVGTLTIYYDYTCNIGSMFAPNKDRYRRAGEVHLSFNHSNIPKPYIHDFIPPNTALDKDQKKSKIDLSKYHTVIAFGDSLMLQLVRQYHMGGFWSQNIRYEENINQCLSNSNDTESAVQKFNQWHRQHILDAALAQPNQSVAVIIGSAVWDAMRGCVRSDFKDHRDAIRQFITTLRSLYPQIHLYWKSPSAIVLHRRKSLEELIDNQIWLHRSRYISDGVPRRIYNVQKELMKELQVPFLDLFDAYYLSAPWTLPGDARHYEDDISFLLLSYYWPGLNSSSTYYTKVKDH